MRCFTFSKRTLKEIIRDPLNLAFGLGFPIVLILLLSAINASIPNNLFDITGLAPGVSVFGLSFMTLFSATLISKDRESAFLHRLYTTPMKSSDFIIGYALPIIPMSLCQYVICMLFSIALGLKMSLDVLLGALTLLPVALLYIFLGLLFGSILTVKQVGGICGALLTNLSAWFSGIWFDVQLVGGVFERIADLLPFIHAVELQKAVIEGNFSSVPLHLLWVASYTAVIAVLALWLFKRQMKKL